MTRRLENIVVSIETFFDILLPFSFKIVLVSLKYPLFQDMHIIISDWLILKFVSDLLTGTETSLKMSSASSRYPFSRSLEVA